LYFCVEIKSDAKGTVLIGKNMSEEITTNDNNIRIKKPKWLRVKLPTGENYKKVRSLVDEHKLHTICESGSCPNMGECWGEGTATFMILGNICTRSCGFCAVKTGRPDEVDEFEPGKVAHSVKTMGIKHAVITSVDRDDLKDGGAGIWVQTVKAIRHQSPGTTMETLIPDFAGKWENLQQIIEVAPEIVSHNLETVRRLTKQVRIQAKYDRSLEVLFRLKKGGMRTKSGVMLGLGETDEEIIETMQDLRAVGVDILTLGQYLQPTPKHLPIVEFVPPERFEKYEKLGLEMGFRFVESGPLVRSSYHAEKHIFDL
jgi:lipoic acid synthetase